MVAGRRFFDKPVLQAADTNCRTAEKSCVFHFAARHFRSEEIGSAVGTCGAGVFGDAYRCLVFGDVIDRD